MSKSNSAEASLKIGHEGAALSRTRMPANAPESFVARFGVDRESRLAAKLCTGRLRFSSHAVFPRFLNDLAIFISSKTEVVASESFG
jgi:hypothetical protein